MSDAPLLRARALRVGYDGRPLLPPLDFELRAAETWALVGRNGSGKTTLLRTLLGLLPAVAGAVERQPGLRIGHVPQHGDHDLSVPRRVIDFVRAGVERGWSFTRWGTSRTAARAVEEALEVTRTGDLRRQQLRELSEGQRQRAQVARALASSPGLLILDEPTSAMDVETEASFLALLERLRADHGLALLVVSHRASFADAHATHFIRLDREHGEAITGPVRATVPA